MLTIFLVELQRSWTTVRRYPLQAVSGALMTFLLFLALLAGIRYVAAPTAQFGDRLDNVIVGYVLWNTLVFAMGNISAGVQGEAQMGTLEQLFLSPWDGATVFLVRALAAQTVTLATNAVILCALLIVTGTTLHFPLALVYPIAAALAACYGLGLTLGAAALVFKRTGAVLQLSQFGLMALVVVPYESWSNKPALLTNALPLVPSAALLRDLMARGHSLDLPQLALAAVNGVAYLALGRVAFRWGERETKVRGSLGTY